MSQDAESTAKTTDVWSAAGGSREDKDVLDFDAVMKRIPSVCMYDCDSERQRKRSVSQAERASPVSQERKTQRSGGPRGGGEDPTTTVRVGRYIVGACLGTYLDSLGT